jgi:hypothetical protein
MAIADVTLAPAVVTSWRSTALVPVSTGLELRFRNGFARQPPRDATVSPERSPRMPLSTCSTARGLAKLNTLVNEEMTYVWSFPVSALTAGVRDPSVLRPTTRGIREHTLTFVP